MVATSEVLLFYTCCRCAESLSINFRFRHLHTKTPLHATIPEIISEYFLVFSKNQNPNWMGKKWLDVNRKGRRRWHHFFGGKVVVLSVVIVRFHAPGYKDSNHYDLSEGFQNCDSTISILIVEEAAVVKLICVSRCVLIGKCSKCEKSRQLNFKFLSVRQW